MLKWTLLSLILSTSMSLHATSFGKHHGYLLDVSEERTKRDIEMVMLEQPKQDSRPLTEVIFNEKLSKEFQQQYRYRFGQTTTEQVINNPSRMDGYTYYTGENLTIKRYQEEQQKFGEYMARRLTEFHIDNWAKNDPAIRPVYELKDKVSNLNVNVRKYKFKWKYNLSGPHMDFALENPYDVELKARAEMTGLVSSPTELIYSMGYQLTQKVRVEGVFRQEDELYQLVLSRPLTKKISGSLTGATDQKVEGTSKTSELILVGVSWSD